MNRTNTHVRVTDSCGVARTLYRPLFMSSIGYETHSDEVVGYIILPVLALGVVGNALALLTFTKGQFSAPTYIYFRCLAVSDGLTTILWMPVAVAYLQRRRTYSYLEVFYTVHIHTLLHSTFFGSSFLLLAVITVDRCIVIFKPLLFRAWNTRSRARNLSILCFVFPMIFFIPVIFAFEIHPDSDGIYVYKIDDDFTEHFLVKAYYKLCAVCCISMYVSIILFTILAVIGYRKLKMDRDQLEAAGRAAAAPPAPARHIQDIQRLLKLMVLIAVMNVIFLAVSVLDVILELSGYLDRTDKQTVYFVLLTNLALSCNSSFNFYVYLIGHRHFRRQCIALLLYFCQQMKRKCCTSTPSRLAIIDVEMNIRNAGLDTN